MSDNNDPPVQTEITTFSTPDGKVCIKTFKGHFYFEARDAASFALVMLGLATDIDPSLTFEELLGGLK